MEDSQGTIIKNGVVWICCSIASKILDNTLDITDPNFIHL